MYGVLSFVFSLAFVIVELLGTWVEALTRVDPFVA
jgi:hypothetical protein